MAGITLTQAETNLNKWIEASESVALGQSYSMSSPDGRAKSLTKADADKIQGMIEFWDSQCKRLSQGSGTVVRFGVPK